MAEVIRFFPRQTLVAGTSSKGDYYSEIFEVAEYSELEAELTVYQTTPPAAVVSGVLEENSDRRLDLGGWTQLGLLTQTGQGIVTATFSNPSRFLRAKLTVPAAAVITVSFEGVGREEV